jgi:hypothetical protein
LWLPGSPQRKSVARPSASEGARAKRNQAFTRQSVAARARSLATGCAILRLPGDLRRRIFERRPGDARGAVRHRRQAGRNAQHAAPQVHRAAVIRAGPGHRYEGPAQRVGGIGRQRHVEQALAGIDARQFGGDDAARLLQGQRLQADEGQRGRQPGRQRHASAFGTRFAMVLVVAALDPGQQQAERQQAGQRSPLQEAEQGGRPAAPGRSRPATAGAAAGRRTSAASGTPKPIQNTGSTMKTRSP